MVDKAKAELESAIDRLAEDVEGRSSVFKTHFGREGESLVSLARNAADVLETRGAPTIEWMIP